MDKEVIVNTAEVMPVLPLSGIVVFPESVFHFDIRKKKSISSIEESKNYGQKIFLVAQKENGVEDPKGKDLYETGCVARIKQILKQGDGEVQVLVEGLYRAKIQKYLRYDPNILGTVVKCKESEYIKTVRMEALIRQIKLIFAEYGKLLPHFSKNILREIQSENDPRKLTDLVGYHSMLDFELCQDLLDETDINNRLDMVFVMLLREVEILKTQRRIHYQVKKNLDEQQKEYFLREQIKVISDELGDGGDQKEIYELQEKIEQLDVDEAISKKLMKECKMLLKMPDGSHEANVLRNHLELCLELPWNEETESEIDLDLTKEILDEDHYGLDKVKERIIETLAVKKLAPDIKGQILCLVGPPGVGKTSIVKSIARAIGRKYARIALGGMRDEAEIRGHRRTYIGAMPGRIISVIKSAGVKNPIILLDEIDKIGSDFKGDPSSALLEVLDAEQNSTFEDHYVDLPFDLSKVFFITTANDISTIPAPLFDRMDTIELSSYTREEKFNIAKKYLLPKQMKKNGIKSKHFKITDGALKIIIDDYTREAGVRGLERKIADLLRKVAKKIVEDENIKISVGVRNIEEYLGPRKFKEEGLDKTDQVGLVNGLAWTSVGGQTLQIEVAIMPGTGKLELTGSLGDVMKESAKAALSCIRMRHKKLKIDPDFYKKYDIHIHVPEGAVPKDGPSAGITMATALVSALSNRPFRHDVAMTGEITLRGRVMPIGGLREKSMAAYKEKIKTVIIPIGNKADLAELDPKVLENIEFIPVSDFNEVIDIALIDNNKKKTTGETIKGKDKKIRKTKQQPPKEDNVIVYAQ